MDTLEYKVILAFLPPLCSSLHLIKTLSIKGLPLAPLADGILFDATVAVAVTEVFVSPKEAAIQELLFHLEKQYAFQV